MGIFKLIAVSCVTITWFINAYKLDKAVGLSEKVEYGAWLIVSTLLILIYTVLI